jgi:phage tail sheath protein FI
MLIVDPPASWATSKDAVNGLRSLGYRSPNVMTYFPRGRPAEGERTPRVAGALLAGSLCRTDRVHGPWAGLDEDGVTLRTALAPAITLDEVDTRLLVRAGINALCQDTAGRLRLVGGRTLSRGSGPHRMFKSLAVRRLFLRIVNAIDVATRWSVFEPADCRRVARVREQVVDYLGQLHTQGAFDNDHFVVLCDAPRKGPDGSVCRGVSLLLVFQPRGCSTPVSFTLHQSPAGCRISSTAFAPLAVLSA